MPLHLLRLERLQERAEPSRSRRAAPSKIQGLRGCQNFSLVENQRIDVGNVKLKCR